MRHGTQQVLYTYRTPGDEDGGQFEECGAMNIFFYIERVSSVPCVFCDDGSCRGWANVAS